MNTIKKLAVAVALLLAFVSPVLADEYATDFSASFSIAEEFLWQPTSATAFGFSSSGSGIWGVGFGADNAAHSVYSGATSGFYKMVYVQTNTAFRVLALSSTETKFALRLTPPAATALDQKLQIWGLTNTTALTTALAAGGGASGTFFRVDATGSAAVIEAVSKNGAFETVTSTGITDATNTYRTYEVIATNSSVTFKIDGTTVATHTTNIPTVALGPAYGIRTKVAVMRVFKTDWFKYESARF